MDLSSAWANLEATSSIYCTSTLLTSTYSEWTSVLPELIPKLLVLSIAQSNHSQVHTQNGPQCRLSQFGSYLFHLLYIHIINKYILWINLSPVWATLDVACCIYSLIKSFSSTYFVHPWYSLSFPTGSVCPHGGKQVVIDVLPLNENLLP